MFPSWNGINLYHSVKRFTTQPRLLTILGKKPSENIVRKGENAGS